MFIAFHVNHQETLLGKTDFGRVYVGFLCNSLRGVSSTILAIEYNGNHCLFFA
jgi:hypothetical protein